MKKLILSLALMPLLLLQIVPADQTTGKVVSFGDIEKTPILTNVIAVAAGGYHALALTADGKVVAWGFNHEGQTNVPINLSNVVSIAAGDRYSLALKNNGTVVGWGDNSFHQTDIPDDLTNAVSISAGSRHALALKKNGSVVSWGGYIGSKVIPGLSNIVVISAARREDDFGGWEDLAISKDGRVIEWNSQTVKQTGVTNAAKVVAGSVYNMALKKDGSVSGWGEFSEAEDTRIPMQLSNVVAIVESGFAGSMRGNATSFALKNDGTIISWGNRHWRSITIPQGVSNIVAISAGNRFCVAIQKE